MVSYSLPGRPERSNRAISTIPQSDPGTQTEKYFIQVLAVVFAVLVLAGAWLNHFTAAFIWTDHTVIEKNPALSSTAQPWRFLSPLAFSSVPAESAWQPLTVWSWARDHEIAKGASAIWSQTSTFIWFIVAVVLFYLFLKTIPGISKAWALFSVIFFAVHPAVAETLNFTSHRGDLIAVSGMLAALCVWIEWPARAPKEMKRFYDVVPTNYIQYLRRQYQPLVAEGYAKLRVANIPFYVIPLVLGLLASPVAAAFPLILLAWVELVEPQYRGKRIVLPVAICTGFFVLSTALTMWKGHIGRLPLFGYLATQPLAIARFFGFFLWPFHLSGSSDIEPLPIWAPLALGGLAVTAGLIVLTRYLTKKPEWRLVAFGFCWFFATLIPDCLVPQNAVDSPTRLFVPMMGLVFALSITFGKLMERLSAIPRLASAREVITGGIVVIALVFGAVMTYQRNEAYQSEDRFWLDVIQKSPRNGRAYMYYALSWIAAGNELNFAYDYMKKAEALRPKDPLVAYNMSYVAQLRDQPDEAEKYMKRSIELDPSDTRATSRYADWLWRRMRFQEGTDMAKKALALDPLNEEARSVLLDAYARRDDWTELKKFAEETLKVLPNNQDAQRALRLITASLALIKREEEFVKKYPSAASWLDLSLVYYENYRYDDCIRAAKEALKLDPTAAQAWANISTAYYTEGKVAEALDATREEVRLNPDLPGAKDNLKNLEEEVAAAKNPAPAKP